MGQFEQLSSCLDQADRPRVEGWTDDVMMFGQVLVLLWFLFLCFFLGGDAGGGFFNDFDFWDLDGF